jgi:hypothetical protein
LVSQPVAGFPSQLPKPGEQVIEQVPLEHFGAPFRLLQTLLQTPQLDVSVAVLISQPLAGFASQSAKPVLHDWMPQLPVVQTGVAFGRLHA